MSGFYSKETISFMGRHAGDSAVWGQMVKDLTLPDILHLDSEEIDQETWHTVQLSYPVADWLKTQDSNQWHTRSAITTWKENYFDIHESLYTMLMLKWK